RAPEPPRASACRGILRCTQGTGACAREVALKPLATAPVTTRILDGFDDPTLGRFRWNALVDKSDTRVGYLTWEFQRAWWETIGWGELRLIAAQRDGATVALAPFYVGSGIVFFVGASVEVDYLDFIGDVSDPAVLHALLKEARDSVPDFTGFDLEFIPDSSRTPKLLAESSAGLGLWCEQDYEMLATGIDLVGHREAVLASVNAKSMLRPERWFTRHGSLQVRHLRNGEEILPHLGQFFAQHRARYHTRDNPSRLFSEKVCGLFERLTVLAAKTGWLRFTRIDWDGRPIAFHYGHCYAGRYFWGTASFAPEVARRSPGKLLLRHLLLAAMEEGACVFDFGTGQQPFKLRLGTGAARVRSWWLGRDEPA
ncbi:MAG: GNAT family N-acetyltransferase, partial [bacterium]